MSSSAILHFDLRVELNLRGWFAMYEFSDHGMRFKLSAASFDGRRYRHRPRHISEGQAVSERPHKNALELERAVGKRHKVDWEEKVKGSKKTKNIKVRKLCFSAPAPLDEQRTTYPS